MPIPSRLPASLPVAPLPRPRVTGWRALVGALLLAGTVVALTASTAAAEMRCHYPPGSNTCLTIEPYVYHWRVSVGIDINMSIQETLDLINAANAVGASPFVARIRGYDGGSLDPWSHNPILFTVPLTATAYWGILNGGGSIVVPGSALNEDTHGSDELYAEVILQDCSNGCYWLQWFHSGFIVDNW